MNIKEVIEIAKSIKLGEERTFNLDNDLDVMGREKIFFQLSKNGTAKTYYVGGTVKELTLKCISLDIKIGDYWLLDCNSLVFVIEILQFNSGYKCNIISGVKFEEQYICLKEAYMSENHFIEKLSTYKAREILNSKQEQIKKDLFEL